MTVNVEKCLKKCFRSAVMAGVAVGLFDMLAYLVFIKYLPMLKGFGGVLTLVFSLGILGWTGFMAVKKDKATIAAAAIGTVAGVSALLVCATLLLVVGIVTGAGPLLSSAGLVSIVLAAVVAGAVGFVCGAVGSAIAGKKKR